MSGSVEHPCSNCGFYEANCQCAPREMPNEALPHLQRLLWTCMATAAIVLAIVWLIII